MKKILYTFLTLFVVLIVLIVFAANSSWLIKKVADKFAPEYKISYKDITGNLFTGVTIAGLKFNKAPITTAIRFSWDPSRLLYKRVQVNSITLEDVDVDTIKALIASFPKSAEDNSSSAPFPLVVNVDKIHVTVNPFEEQGISFEKTAVDIKDLSYAADSIEVGSLKADIETGVAKLELDASLEKKKLSVNVLKLTDIDTVALEALLPEADANASKEKVSEASKTEDEAAPSPFIPQQVEVHNLLASIKPRLYESVRIDKVELRLHGVAVDMKRAMAQKGKAVEVESLSLLAESNVSVADLDASLKGDTLTIEKIDLEDVNVTAIMALLPRENNATASADEAQPQKQEEKSDLMNPMVPHFVVLRSLKTTLTPAQFDPLKLKHLLLEVADLHFDTRKLMAQKGSIDLNATTNLSDLVLHGNIKNNQLKGSTKLTPEKELFSLYAPTLRPEAFSDITIDIDASEERVVADISMQAKQILKAAEQNTSAEQNMTVVSADGNLSTETNTTLAANEQNATQFNVDIDSLGSHIVYSIEGGKVDANTTLRVSTPYTEKVTLCNLLTKDEGIHYEGALTSDSIKGLDANLTAALKGLHIVYSGDLSQITTDIESEGLKGYFNSKDLNKSARFHLETKAPLKLDTMFPLPEKLKGSRLGAVIDVPVNMQKPLPIKATATVRSNLANLDATLSYGKKILLQSTTRIPKDSLLKNIDKHIKWQAISPLQANVTVGERSIDALVKSSKLRMDLGMKPYEGSVSGKIKLAGLSATLNGLGGKDVVISSDVSSFSVLMDTIRQFYAIDTLPKVEGKLDIKAVIKPNGNAKLTLSAPEVLYHADRKTVHKLDNVKITLGQTQRKVMLDSYNVEYNTMHFFSTKPSVVDLKDGVATVKQLWLNDELKVTGKLDTKTMKGELFANADRFQFSQEMIDLESQIGIKTKFNGPNTTVTGNISLLGGDIHYDMGKKSFASDSDIVIVQQMKKEEASPFMDNLSIKLKIDSKKPLIYKQGPVNMKANIDMRVLKSIKSDILVLGSIDLVKGGWYDFQGKRFVLEKGHIYLTGDPKKPILDIEVKYQAQDHLITIAVSGTPEAPVINFSSIPSLSKEQILSVILFDSESGAGSNSSEDMMKMMGGAMAKSALSDMGVKIDHLVLGQHGDVEIGKKLTDKITVIYINDEIPEIKAKYRYSKSTEGILTVDEISQSLDVVYKKDLSGDDIIKFVGGKRKK